MHSTKDWLAHIFVSLIASQGSYKVWKSWNLSHFHVWVMERYLCFETIAPNIQFRLSIINKCITQAVFSWQNLSDHLIEHDCINSRHIFNT